MCQVSLLHTYDMNKIWSLVYKLLTSFLREKTDNGWRKPKRLLEGLFQLSGRHPIHVATKQSIYYMSKSKLAYFHHGCKQHTFFLRVMAFRKWMANWRMYTKPYWYVRFTSNANISTRERCMKLIIGRVLGDVNLQFLTYVRYILWWRQKWKQKWISRIISAFVKT